MRILRQIFFLAALCFSSCVNENNSAFTKEWADTRNNFYVYNCDDYPLEDSLFDSENDIEIGNLISYEKWFTNDTLQQTLTFYICIHRMFYSHFINDLPDEIKTKICFYQLKENKDIDNEILTHFNEFVSRAKRIKQDYFTSKRNIFLGKHKNQILLQMGTPDSESCINDIEILLWDPITGPTSSTEMFFRDDTLIAVFYVNDAI